jgi:drug/metabolite transporter (DMT)-like permease
VLSILFGIASSLSWGAGDFAGGLSSRKVGAYRAVLYADFFGLLILSVAALFYREVFPSTSGFVNSLLGGALGSFGLLILYYSLTVGQMSVAAPVSALFAALLPVVYGAMTEGLPTLIQFIGFGLALAAVWLISQDDGGFHVGKLSDLKFPILAGVGFGSYFIFIHDAVGGTDSLLWPMLISRLAGTVMLFFIVLARRESFPVPREAWGVVLVNAVLDLGGNFFYILASKAGRLDIAAVLSSLYPGATVVLAWIVLKERITRVQLTGILIAFASIYLFTL